MSFSSTRWYNSATQAIKEVTGDGVPNDLPIEDALLQEYVQKKYPEKALSILKKAKDITTKKDGMSDREVMQWNKRWLATHIKPFLPSI